MKKYQLVVLCSTVIMLWLSLSSYSAGPAAGGAGDLSAGGCSCHGPSAAGTMLTLQLIDSATLLPVTTGAYTPGKTYNVIVGGSSTSSLHTHFGFQLAVKNSSGTDAGTLSTVVTSTTTQIYTAGGTNGVEHSTSIAATSGAFSTPVRWKAPAAGAGPVSFKLALNAVNNNGGTTGDAPNVDTFNFAAAAGPTAISPAPHVAQISVYPNPAKTTARVSVPAVEQAGGTIFVYAPNGTLAHQQAYTGSAVADLDLRSLPNGSYRLVLIPLGGWPQSVPLVVAR